MRVLLVAALFCCLAAALPPPVPHDAADVPAYLAANHGFSLARAFAEARLATRQSIKRSDPALLQTTADSMARSMMAGIADQPAARQHEYLTGIQDRLRAGLNQRQ